jgi:hypothetical protein
MLTYGDVWRTQVFNDAAAEYGAPLMWHCRDHHYCEGTHTLTHVDVCSRMLTYAHVCSRMLTYAHVCSRMLTYAGERIDRSHFAYADIC